MLRQLEPDLDGAPAREVLRFAIRSAPFGPGLFLLAFRRLGAPVCALRVDVVLGVFGGLRLCYGFLFEGLERRGARALILGQVALWIGNPKAQMPGKARNGGASDLSMGGRTRDDRFRAEVRVVG